jgi:hypothetical protein
MTERRHAVAFVFAGLTVLGISLAGVGPASADSAEPTPTPTSPPALLPVDASAMTPNQPAVPPVDAVAAPAARDPFTPYVPEIQNPTYGSGNSGGGVLGTLKDLWHQVQNPTFAPNEIMGSGPGAPAAAPGSAPVPAAAPGSAPVPALPPGYVSTNFPGSETASTAAAGGSAALGPALPPGYYPITGPPPPGYSYGTAPAPTPAVAALPTTVLPSP